MAENTFDFLGQNAEANAAGETNTPADDFGKIFQDIKSQNSDLPVNTGSPTSFVERMLGPVGPKGVINVPDAAVDPYKYQEGFDRATFNPLAIDNYEKFAARETFGSALSKGFDSFGHKFGNTFVDYWKGYGRMADALISLDWDKMRPDEAAMAEMYYQDQIDMSKNFVFERPENEDSIFNKRTMSEFISNAGFALGTFAGMGIEIAADVAITALSGGAGAISFGATAARIAGKEGASTLARTGLKLTDNLADLGKGFSYANRSTDEIAALANTAEKIGQTKAIANMPMSTLRNSMNETFNIYTNNLFNVARSKTFSEFTENLLKDLPVVGAGARSAEKLALASKAGANTGQLIGMGAQGLRRVAQELNMSATEASFEAITSYGDTLDKMVQKYQAENNGAIPSSDEFERMRKLAMDASSSNYNTNLGLLLATNKIQFGNLFNKFIPANKFMSEASEKLLEVEGKTAAGVFRKDGFFGAYGLTGKIAKEFGKKEAAYQFSKAFAKDFLQFEVSEGIQENIQETSASAWRDYYAGQYFDTKETLSQAFGKGFEEQLTKQGLKTFLMGALTGSVIRIPTALAEKAMDAANTASINNAYKNNPDQNPLKIADKQLNEDLIVINDVLKDIKQTRLANPKEGSMKQKLFNFNSQVDAALQQSEAAAKGLEYEFHNAKDNALLAAVAAANRTGSSGVLYRAIKDMGKDMTAEEFEKSYGIKLEDTKYKTPSEFSEAVARDLKKYSDIVDNIRTKMKSKMMDPSQFEAGSSSQYAAAIVRSVQEDAIQILAMNAIKGEMTAKRAKELSEQLLSVPGMSSSADYALRVLTGPKLLDGEIGNAEAEYRLLLQELDAEGLDADTKKDIKERLANKERELELLDKWKSFWSTREEVIGRNAEGKEVMGTVTGDIFIGKAIERKQTIKNENDEEVETVEKTYDPTDKEVVEVFRELMNIRNKQAGVDTVLSEQSLQDGFQKIYDYIRLDTDTRDYMRSVDALTNPETLRITMLRMIDGKFKHHLIMKLEEIMFNTEMRAYTIMQKLPNLNDADKQEVFKTLINALINNDNYKNIGTIISDPNTGIQNEAYVAAKIDALIKDLENIEADILNKYAPAEQATGDIAQEVYDEIIATKTIDPTTKNLIAGKLKDGEKLGELEQKVYDIHKEAIDELNKKPVFKTPVIPVASSTVDTTGMQGFEEFDPESETVRRDPNYIEPVGQEITVSDLPASQNEEIEEINTTEEVQENLNADLGVTSPIHIDTYLSGLHYVQTQDGKYYIIPDTNSAGYAGITAIEVTREQIIRPFRTEAEWRKVGVEVNPRSASVSNEPSLTAADIDHGNQQLADLLGLGTVETIEAVNNQETAFAVAGNPAEGYKVVDTANTPVTEEVIPVEEDALALAESLNNTDSDREFVRNFMGPGLEEHMYTKMLEACRKSMKHFNTRKGGSFTTLQEYAKSNVGADMLQRHKEAILTGKPVNYKKKKAAVTVTPQLQSVELFETPSTSRGASLTLSSLENLYAKVVEFKAQALQNPNNFSKFVEGDAVTQLPVTESSILSKLQEITTCFS